MEEELRALATHLREYHEPSLAAALEDALVGDRHTLPHRVLSLFRHGMGGLLDVDLHRDGVVDLSATTRRNELAESLFEAAKRETP